MNLKNYEIVFITRENKSLPGARYRAYNFSNCLKKEGYASFVLSYPEELGALSGNLEGYITLRDKLRYNKKAYQYLKRFKNPLLVIQRFNYHAFGPLLYAFKHKIQYIYDIDDWEFREDISSILGFLPRSKAEFIFRMTVKKSLFCLTGSNFLHNYLKNITSRTFYLAPGINTELFKIKQNYSNKETITLAWVGTMFRYEDFVNLQSVLKIFKTNPNLKLEIAGAGAWKLKLEEEVNKQRIRNIEFKGWIAPDEIPDYLENADIGIFPVAVENRFTEAKFPVKILEFMAKGIPVVATRFGEAKRIIENGKDGILVDNEEDFLKAILKLSENPSLREEIGIQARGKIENNYKIEQQTRKLVSIFENAQ